jgi:ribonuclease P protein component
LTVINEKDVPTSQSPPQKNARLSGQNGFSRRTPGSQPTARKGSPTAGDLDTAQAARLGDQLPRALSFRAADKLRKKSEFALVRRKGLRAQTSHFLLFAFALPGEGRTRLGVTISRRIGKAAARNRLRRRIRECFRIGLRPLVPHDTALLIVAREGASSLPGPTINDELKAATLLLGQKLRRT